MPELPEVETLVRRLRTPLIGRTIVRAAADWPRSIGYPPPEEFARRIRGLTVQAIARRAKYLVFELGDHTASHLHFLLIHLKMSGKLRAVSKRAPTDKHDHVIFDLDDGRQLRFNDVRKFGRVYLLDHPDEVTGQHGPEPLDQAFTPAKFRALIKERSGAIKPLLLNQKFIAGVGNIYADEALWRAKIHPLRKTDSLKDAEIVALYRSIRQTLRQAIKAQGTDAGDGVIDGDYQPRVYGREGKPCYRCHHPIHKTTVGQRGTHYCPTCQPKRGR